jgi:hypothetical protein
MTQRAQNCSGITFHESTDFADYTDYWSQYRER